MRQSDPVLHGTCGRVSCDSAVPSGLSHAYNRSCPDDYWSRSVASITLLSHRFFHRGVGRYSILICSRVTKVPERPQKSQNLIQYLILICSQIREMSIDGLSRCTIIDQNVGYVPRDACTRAQVPKTLTDPYLRSNHDLSVPRRTIPMCSF